VKFEGVGQNRRYRKTEVEIFQNVHNRRQNFCQILRTFTIEVVINSNHVVQHLAIHTVSMYCPLWTTLCFFSISNNDYNTVGKLITIINDNDSATMCCRNRVSLYVRVCKQNSWRNMTDFDKFHWMDCLQNYHWFGLICISISSGQDVFSLGGAMHSTTSSFLILCVH